MHYLICKSLIYNVHHENPKFLSLAGSFLQSTIHISHMGYDCWLQEKKSASGMLLSGKIHFKSIYLVLWTKLSWVLSTGLQWTFLKCCLCHQESTEKIPGSYPNVDERWKILNLCHKLINYFPTAIKHSKWRDKLEFRIESPSQFLKGFSFQS